MAGRPLRAAASTLAALLAPTHEAIPLPCALGPAVVRSLATSARFGGSGGGGRSGNFSGGGPARRRGGGGGRDRDAFDVPARRPMPPPPPGGGAAAGPRPAGAPPKPLPELTRTPATVLKAALRKRVVYQEAPQSVRTRVWLPPEDTPGQRCLRVAIVGAPNAGKSTLLNRLLGSRVSAVSAKYNTTRDRVTGIYTHAPSRTQLIFTDTPGFVPETGSGSTRYSAPLVRAAREAVPESDVVILVIDAARRFEAEQAGTLQGLATLCARSGVLLAVVANKVDLLRGAHLTRAVGLLKVAAAAAGGTGAGAAPAATEAAPPSSPSSSSSAAAAAEPLWLTPEQLRERAQKSPAADGAAAPVAPADDDAAAAAAAADAAGDGDGEDADRPDPLAQLGAGARASLLSLEQQHGASSGGGGSGGRRPDSRREVERRVLAAKLDLLREAFEAAAYSAGLVGPGGFDEPLLGRRRRPSGLQQQQQQRQQQQQDAHAAASLDDDDDAHAAAGSSGVTRDPVWAALSAGSDADLDDDDGSSSSDAAADALRRFNAVTRPGGDAGVASASSVDADGDAYADEGGDRHALAVPPSAVYRVLPPVLPMAAGHGEGVEALRDALLRLAPARRWEYSSAQTTDLSPLERLAEVVREKLFAHLHAEVPYRVRQVNRSWRVTPHGELVVDQDVQVPSRAVARMLTARGGGPIKAITRDAIADLEAITGRRVHLFLHIAVKEALAKGGGGDGGGGGGGPDGVAPAGLAAAH